MWKEYLRYIGFMTIIGLCKILPGRFLYWVALRVADLNYGLLDPRGREAVKANLRQVLPGASEERIAFEARWIFRNFGKYLTEFFRIRTFDKAYVERCVAIKGQEHIESALAQDKGCILLTAHLSNWELGTGALAMLSGYKVNVVAAMHRYGRINNLFMRERESMGLHVIDMMTAPTQVMRALRNKEIVGMLGDRDPTEQGIEVDFFGKPCRFPQGPARFAIATGAPIVPGFALRRTNDAFTVVFEPPIFPPLASDGDKRELARELTQRYARVFEEAIRWHPEEWGVFYRLWEEEWRP